MFDVLALTLTFAMIVVLLRRRMDVGAVMLAASAAMTLLYRMSPSAALQAVISTVIDPVTVKLALALTLIRIFELVLRERGVLAEMTSASSAVLRHPKASIVSMPMLIGMVPSVGGAYFSAPMVAEATSGLRMSAEEKSFVNYWFRHPWEMVLPVYPGIVLAAALADVRLADLILRNTPAALLLAAGGFALSMKGVGQTKRGKRLTVKGVLSFLPIIVVLALVVAARIELYLAFVLVLAALFATFRYRPKEIAKAAAGGFSFSVVVLIFGVMLFKQVMEASGSVESLSGHFSSWGVPLLPMLFLLPFVTGMLTGLAIGFVGATFPLLMSLAGQGSAEAAAFAFVAGFTGVLLSPVHVCLVLTREYFKADMGGIYRRMLPAAGLIMAGAVAVYLL